MSDPAPTDPQPGERPPPTHGGGRLERPPSDRYRVRAPGAAADASSAPRAGRRASAVGPIGTAVVVGIIGAVALAVILGLILATTGTFVVCLLAGAAIGLLVAGAAVGPSPTLSRSGATRVAIGLALGMVVLGGLLTWLIARSEGGVMDPVSYLWTTFGFGTVAQAIVAVVAAAWGAMSGPIRWRE